MLRIRRGAAARTDRYIATMMRRLWRSLRLWRDRIGGRRELARMAELDWADFALKDIGISRAEARRESEKPFWRG